MRQRSEKFVEGLLSDMSVDMLGRLMESDAQPRESLENLSR
jgi:hypothetical protein